MTDKELRKIVERLFDQEKDELIERWNRLPSTYSGDCHIEFRYLKRVRQRLLNRLTRALKNVNH